MARSKAETNQITDEEVKTTQPNEQPNDQQNNDQEQDTASPAPVEVVLLKNIRHTTGVRRKGEKIAVAPEEAQELIFTKLARLPE